MERTDKIRPFPMGVSIGHHKVTTGTAGCIVEDSEGREYILSNNHVLANSNDAEPGDTVIQPGSYDGGILSDAVATLHRFTPIAFPDTSGCALSQAIAWLLNSASKLLRRKTRFYTRVEEVPVNTVDCAIARPLSGDLYTTEILERGVPQGSAKVGEGEKVYKSGRTTGLTEGTVLDDEATIDVGYGYATARFIHQILVQGTRFIQGGDSGSVLLNKDGYVVGLCFAGSGDGRIGIANHIYSVEQQLAVRVKKAPPGND